MGQNTSILSRKYCFEDLSCPINILYNSGTSCILRNEGCAMGRPNVAVVLTEQEREQLEALTRSRSMPHALVRRARIVLVSAGGLANEVIAQRCAVSAHTVSLWRQRYRTQGMAGLHDELRPGRPRTHDDEQVAALINRVLHTKPKGATHWSVRLVAEETGISKSTVGRYFKLFGLQPHRSNSFKLSTTPFFVENVRDIVGLYLNPPDHAFVLCVDHKSRSTRSNAPTPSS